MARRSRVDAPSLDGQVTARFQRLARAHAEGANQNLSHPRCSAPCPGLRVESHAMRAATTVRLAAAKSVAPDQATLRPPVMDHANSWVKTTGATILVRLETAPTAPCNRPCSSGLTAADISDR